MSDQDIWNLKRGGHDYRKVYAALSRRAVDHKGQPTVTLAKTISYALGKHFEGRLHPPDENWTLKTLRSFVTRSGFRS